MRWRIGNLTIRVEDPTEAENAFLREFLSFTERRYNPGKKRWHTTTRSLYEDVIAKDFPTGLGRLAFPEAKKREIAVEIVDDRILPALPDPETDLEWLRHHPAVKTPITHQIESVQAVMKHKRGIVWVPTGGGKTEIAIGITKAIPCRWLFLVHRTDLLQQTADRFQLRTGEEAGVIGDGKVSLDKRFIVCSFQSAHSAVLRQRQDVLQILESVGGLIVDECHALPAETFWGVVMRAREAYYRVGLSGTPLARGDNRNLLAIGALGPVIYRIMPEELIKIGLLARPTIRMIPVAQKVTNPTWRGAYGAGVIRSKVRNQALLDIAHRAEKPSLLFVQNINHGRTLLKLLQKDGINTEFVWGEKATVQRQTAIRNLERGATDVLIANVIFQEGVDIPSLRSIIMGSAGASSIAVVQKMGRGMRADAKSRKTTFEVWDIADVGCGCENEGEPHRGCRWLRDHTKDRKRAFKREGFEVEVEDGQLNLLAS